MTPSPASEYFADNGALFEAAVHAAGEYNRCYQIAGRGVLVAGIPKAS